MQLLHLSAGITLRHRLWSLPESPSEIEFLEPWVRLETSWPRLLGKRLMWVKGCIASSRSMCIWKGRVDILDG